MNEDNREKGLPPINTVGRNKKQMIMTFSLGEQSFEESKLQENNDSQEINPGIEASPEFLTKKDSSGGISSIEDTPPIVDTQAK